MQIGVSQIKGQKADATKECKQQREESVPQSKPIESVDQRESEEKICELSNVEDFGQLARCR